MEKPKNFDELVTEEEREIIRELEASMTRVCPYLRKEENFFYYCKAGLDCEQLEKKEPIVSSAIYEKRLSIQELQLFCMNNFENCLFYKMFSER